MRVPTDDNIADCPSRSLCSLCGDLVGVCAACCFYLREQYGLLKLLQAVERPAYLDPVFQNAQTWNSLSVREVFSNM